MKIVKPKTIVLITGAFVSYAGWEEWKTFFEENGYTVIVPSGPHKEAPAPVLRQRHPDAAIASLTMAQLLDYYQNIITQLPEKPILIGHSLGGLVTQLLVQRGLATMGVCYHSVAPAGVLSFAWSFLKSVTPALGIFSSTKKTYLMSFKHWQYTFTNGMSLADQQDSYNKSVIPESRNLMRDGLRSISKVDFNRPHVPLLFVSGDIDHIMPASLNLTNFKKYKHKNSVTEYKEFKGRNHYAMSQPTWKEDINFILNWIRER
ncbi:alpha/beta hydrolase [Pedobacter frigiditerrae]|uniref:Alpha/beta hydrolase n=1 Tax=Pedobacter frigiditerrae TaxID=2530452 RepID=A0A4R0MP14_9SPHI|nr:alpha/beta hydrolase [Pedobacter frigiditerrae]TCC88530.1 alpha/beta hydrolase [Pedobacter frigiditerrae]